MRQDIKIQGIILAGGMSRRFGSDKALTILDPDDPRNILERMRDQLHDSGLDVAVVTRAQADFDISGCQIIRDLLPDLGPLMGIFTAMSFIVADAYLILTCDMPCVSRHLLIKILNSYRGKKTNIVCTQKGVIQPFPVLLTRECLVVADCLITQRRLDIKGFIENVDEFSTLPYSDSCFDFFNMNTQDDFLKIKKWISSFRHEEEDYDFGSD